MSNITRSTDLSIIGLSEQDLESRAVVCVGYAPKELLPPFSSTLHETTAKKILEYAEKKDAPLIESIVKEEDLMLPGSKSRVVELVGASTMFCILTGAYLLAKQGTFAYVNPSMTINTPKTYPAFTNGRILLFEFMHPDNRKEPNLDYLAFIYKGNFLLYQASKTGLPRGTPRPKPQMDLPF